jgi:hypothetical protein
MPRPDTTALRKQLLRAGISPGHVHRTLTELGDHFDDLASEFLDQGHSLAHSEERALAILGDLNDVARAMRHQSALKSWAWRWPRVAMIVYPLACLAALPAVPVLAGAQNVASIARWAAGLVLGAFVTAAMFLALQLAITLT